MKQLLSACLLALTTTLTPLNSAIAAPQPRILSGQVAQERVNALTTQITWLQSLQQAEATARQQGKMIFWVQMLGSMDGAT